MLKTIESLGDLSGRAVLVRVNFDIPVKDGLVLPDNALRIKAAIPFLNQLSKKGARTVILSHLGRPGGVARPDFSLMPVFSYLKKEIGDLVSFSPEFKKPEHDGKILLFENLRFYPGERANDRQFAQKLASLGEVYINNDFANSHRSHASMVALPQLLPSAAGPIIKKETEELSAIKNFSGPELVLVIGGAKAKTKLPVIANFLAQGNRVLVGGVVANTLLKAKGFSVGRSIVDKDLRNLENIDLASSLLTLPQDVVVSQSLDSAQSKSVKDISEVLSSEFIVDIGPETRDLFSQKLSGAQRIFWSGPLGVIEVPEFRQGSRVFSQVFLSKGAKTTAGGGDMVSFLSQENLLDKVGYVSTGGGAMLEFLAGKELPGLKVLGYYDAQ